MFRVFSCIDGEHNLWLVALAVVVSIVTSVIAINLLHRARTTNGRARIVWIATAGIAGGCAIWSTHFIAMLAYEPGVPVAFDPILTGLSFICGTAFMALAVAVTVVVPSRLGAGLGGIAVTTAVAGMHYIGMAALEVPGDLHWLADFVIVSIVLGAAFGTIAMYAARGGGVAMTLLASFALSTAIVALHFTGMAAIEFIPNPAKLVTPSSVSPDLLALSVAAVTTLVLALGAVGMIVDERMSRKSEQLEAALDNMNQGLCMLNGNYEAELVNGRFLEMFGIHRRKVTPGMSMKALMDLAESSAPFAAGCRDGLRDWAGRLARTRESGKTIFQRIDGRVFAVSHQHMPKTDGWVETFEDITERRQAEEKIAYMARHDGLTDLPNRVQYSERLVEAVGGINRGGMFAVLCLDLDRFKSVNDTLGHVGGDQLLRVTAARLRGALRETDMIARIGGDEFAILQNVKDQPAAATALARRLIDVMSEPVEIGEQQMRIGVSIGISLAPTDSIDPEQLFKDADLALYRAKADGRGTYRFFESEMDACMQARRLLELDLRDAVATRAFELHYQPIMDIRSDRVTGFEALLRWSHPTRGVVPPLDFIPLAEETGLILSIGEWVLAEACARAVEWPKHVRVAVNLSPMQFKSNDLVATVVDALTKSGLSPQCLELEITESVMLQDSKETLATLHQLRALGVSISMDDFGTGYSSLSYLRKFPFDKIKIDQSFIRDLSLGGESLAIVRAVTGLSSSLGIATVAEGVETIEQLNCLKDEGCAAAQGFYFGKAKPASELAEYFVAKKTLRVVA